VNVSYASLVNACGNRGERVRNPAAAMPCGAPGEQNNGLNRSGFFAASA
jgi:hypothetical protein